MTNAVDLHDISVSFRGLPVLQNVSLTVSEQDFLGLIGPNGAGKTVLLNVMLGLVKPDSGTVSIFGREPSAARGLVAHVPQHGRFDFDYPIKVIDVVLMGRLGRARMFRRWNAEDRRRAHQALERVGLDASAERQIGRLSGGQLQRTLIARALAGDARLLLFDEPTASLDSRVVPEVYELIAELARERAVVLVSHDIAILPRYVKSVACLNQTLHHHPSNEITSEMIESAYGCPVDMLVHTHTHRVMHEHEGTAP